MLVRSGIALLASLVLLWLVLVAVLLVRRPRGISATEVAGLLPDLIRMLGGLARDRELPRRVRWRVWALLAYLALPIDLIPDFIPVIGLLDDVVLAYLVLRSVVRRAGEDVLRRHWAGSPEGLGAVERALGIALP